jgi:hypothetical protein
MIRHVLTPSVSYSLTPDFGDARYGYYKSYTYTDSRGEVRTVDYSPYAGSLYGVPGKGKSGSINLNVSNNVEMKVNTDRDSTGVRKISLIDELGGSISYNMAAKTQPWSNLSTRLRLKLTKNYTFSLNSVWATYAYEFNENGRVVVGDRTEWSYGRFGRFQGYGTSFSYTLNNDTFKKLFAKLSGNEVSDEENAEEGSEEDAEEETENESAVRSQREKRQAVAGEDGYQAFSMPWSINLSTGFNIREDRSKPINKKTMRYPYKVSINALNINGNLKISNKWNISFNSGYDFQSKQVVQTTFNITRDLHCFNMSASLAPFGPWKYYNFTLRANSSILQDLKWEQRSQTQSNIKWY